MYRESTATSTKDYTIHMGAVQLTKDYYYLRFEENKESKREKYLSY